MGLNAKKMISTILLSAIILGNTTSFAMAANASNAKSKKLGDLSKRLQTLIEKDINRNIVKLKNTSDKASYRNELADISADLTSFSSKMQYGSDQDYNAYIAELRSEAKTYLDLKKEIGTYLASGESPFAIKAEDTAKVEQDILTLQKEVVSKIREKIETYSGSSFKDTGKSSFEISTELGKVGIRIEKYTNIMALLTLSQEIDFLISLDFDIKLPGASNYINGKIIKGESMDVKGDMRFDVNIKMIDKDMYLNLKDYAINLTPSKKDAMLDAQLASFKAQLDTVKGKTVHLKIPAETKSGTNQAEAINMIKSILEILEKNPLLTTYKKSGDGFALKLKSQTILKLNEIKGVQKVNQKDMENAVRESIKAKIIYNSMNGAMILTQETNENGWTVKSALKKKESGYSFQMDGKSATAADIGSFNLYLEKKIVRFSMAGDNEYIKLDYAKDNLSIDMKSDKYTLRIAGPLSEEKTDLVISLNGKDIGTFRYSEAGNKRSFEFKITLDMPANTLPEEVEMKTVTILISGENELQSGEFTVTKPKTYIEFDSLSGKSGAIR